MVEDDLAKYLVLKFLHNIRAEENKRIQVLPVGGYSNTCDVHNSLLSDRILEASTKIVSIIDGDVKVEAQSEIREKRISNQWGALSDDDILYLPIPSLEKYLKIELFDKENLDIARKIRDQFYKFESDPAWFLPQYLRNIENKKTTDRERGKEPLSNNKYFANGKNLFGILTNKAREYGFSESAIRQQLCLFVADYINAASFEAELNVALRNFI